MPFTGGAARELWEQMNTCSCLNLILACIIYRQACEISRVLSECDPGRNGSISPFWNTSAPSSGITSSIQSSSAGAVAQKGSSLAYKITRISLVPFIKTAFSNGNHDPGVRELLSEAFQRAALITVSMGQNDPFQRAARFCGNFQDEAIDPSIATIDKGKTVFLPKPGNG